MFKNANVLYLFVVFGLFGIIVHIICSGVIDLVKNKSFALRANVSLWLFLAYGLLAFVFPPVREFVAGHVWYVKGIVYTVSFYVVQYVFGWILVKVTGDNVWGCPTKFNIGGIIDVIYAPVWFAAGLVLEKIYPQIVKAGSFIAGLI